VWKNPQICFTEVDKDQDVQNGIWVEIAQTNYPELQQILQERMNRKSQTAPEIILKHHYFISMGHWEGLTAGWPPSDGDLVRKNTRLHHPVDLRLPHSRWHPFLVMAGYGGRLLRFHNFLFRCHFSDLIWDWWRKHVWIWKRDDRGGRRNGKVAKVEARGAAARL